MLIVERLYTLTQSEIVVCYNQSYSQIHCHVMCLYYNFKSNQNDILHSHQNLSLIHI